MKTQIVGAIVEVGDIDGSDGSREPGMLLDVDGVDSLMFIPLSMEECQNAGVLLYRRVRMTVEIQPEEASK